MAALIDVFEKSIRALVISRRSSSLDQLNFGRAGLFYARTYTSVHRPLCMNTGFPLKTVLFKL